MVLSFLFVTFVDHLRQCGEEFDSLWQSLHSFNRLSRSGRISHRILRSLILFAFFLPLIRLRPFSLDCRAKKKFFVIKESTSRCLIYVIYQLSRSSVKPLTKGLLSIANISSDLDRLTECMATIQKIVLLFPRCTSQTYDVLIDLFRFLLFPIITIILSHSAKEVELLLGHAPSSLKTILAVSSSLHSVQNSLGELYTDAETSISEYCGFLFPLSSPHFHKVRLEKPSM